MNAYTVILNPADILAYYRIEAPDPKAALARCRQQNSIADAITRSHPEWCHEVRDQDGMMLFREFGIFGYGPDGH